MLPFLILTGIPYAIYVLYVIIIAVRSIINGDKEKTGRFGKAVLLISEVVFTTVAPIIGFARFDQYGPEIPFSKHHVLSIILLVIVSSASFWGARFTEGTRNPLIRILFSTGLLQGIFLCFITTIHFLSFIPMGLLFPLAGFELLAPLIALFLLIREFYFYNKLVSIPELLPYREELGFVPLPFKILEMPLLPRTCIYTSLLVCALGLQIGFGYAFGQDIDGIVKAFTESTGFIFSN
jgi:hypothetical protein